SSAAGCSWSAASNVGWITITSGASGSGNGSVNYSVASYGTISGHRQGTLTVAGQTGTIDQVGPPRPPREEEDLQMGMLPAPGCGPGPKAARPQPNATSRWLAIPFVRVGLALLILCGVLALILRTGWRQARRRFTRVAACVVLRLRDQIASRLGELF